jgi:hypothetical protein
VRNLFKRGTDIPARVLERARLRPGEKPLAGTAATDGTWLLGTRDALLVVPAAESTAPEVERVATTRIPWEQVERADWDRDSERLRVMEVGEFGQVRPQHTFAIEDPDQLLPLVRERVTASVVLQRRVVLSGRTGFFVIARRSPSGTGEITWAYEFDPGVDPDDPEVRAAAEQSLQVAAEELGLT